jgi:hypothetical protein
MKGSFTPYLPPLGAAPAASALSPRLCALRPPSIQTVFGPSRRAAPNPHALVRSRAFGPGIDPEGEPPRTPLGQRSARSVSSSGSGGRPEGKSSLSAQTQWASTKADAAPAAPGSQR